MTEKEIKNKLLSNNNTIILQALESIKTEGSSELLPHIFDLLIFNDDFEVQHNCIKILENLKNQSSATYLIDAIVDPKYERIKPELVSICWKNSLEYTNHLNVFIDIIIKDSYMVAFDALTIIDNTLINFDDSDIKEALVRLKEYINSCPEDKKALVKSAIGILMNM